MKKLTAGLVVLFVSAAGAARAEDWKVGVVGGLNYGKTVGFDFGTIAQGETLEVGRRVGFAVGGILEYKSLRIEPKFLRRVSHVSDTKSGQSLGDYNQTLSYLDVPVMLKSAFFKDNKVRPYLSSGLSAGFLLSARSAGTAGSQSFDVSIKNRFTTVDFGIIAGVGVEGEVGKNILSVDVRVGASLIRIDANPKAGAAKVKNTGYQLMVSYTIPVGK